MNYTSAQANKLLKKLNDEYTALLDKETRSRDFRAAMGEDVESVRPVYDYAETQIRLTELEAKIRKLKHAINIFNATQTAKILGLSRWTVRRRWGAIGNLTAAQIARLIS